MATGLTKSSKKTVVQLYLEAVERAREMYFAAVKRAEADLVERMKKAMEALDGDGDDGERIATPPLPQQPEQQQSAA